MKVIQLLFVEDDQVDQKNFERYVLNNKLSYQYQLAATLSDAIKLLQMFDFDLIVADITLPDGSAFDLYKYIPDFIPVIFITGSANKETILKALKVGVADYIIKEVNGNHLNALANSIYQAINKQNKLCQHVEKLILAHKKSLTDKSSLSSTREQNYALEALAFKTHIGVAITDANAHILRINKAFTSITGYSSSEAIGKNMNILKSGKQDQAFYKTLWKQLIKTGRYEGAIWNRGKDHSLYLQWATITAITDKNEENINYICIFSNITEKHKAEQQIQQLAFYDPLTSLANRRLLINRLKQELAIAKRSQLYGSLIYLDVDKFKSLNDSSGHHIGDQLLTQIAQRLTSLLREEDTASRFGGDEFIVLIHASKRSSQHAQEDALIIANKIKLQLNKPYQLDDGKHFFTPSIGIAIFPDNDHFAEQVLQHADKAMYCSKNKGGNFISIFQADEDLVPEESALHILLIEDSITDTFLTTETLKEFSEEYATTIGITSCSDGEAGLEFLNNKDNSNFLPDLILLDLNLPKIDGYQILSQVKSNPQSKNIPVVVFTVTTEYTIIDKCIELQADDFIQKPLTVNVFKQTLDNLSLAKNLI